MPVCKPSHYLNGNIKTKLVIPILALTFSFFISCKEKESTAPEQKTSSVIVDAVNGGNVSTEDGISLNIPPGALPNDTEVKLTSLSGSEMHEWGISTVHLEPDGLILDKTAKLTFQLPAGWPDDHYPFVFVSFDSDPADYLNTGACADIIQTENGLAAEISILHFSHWGLVRNCHKGTLITLLQNFEQNGCDNATAWDRVSNKYPGINTDIISNSQPDHNTIQGFLGTYFKDNCGFNENEAITEEKWSEILNFIKTENKRVTVLFTGENWDYKDSKGFYTAVPHSAVFDFKDGKLKLRNSISAGAKYLDPLIARNGENVIWLPKEDRDITLDDLNSFRNTRSFEALENELSDSPQLFSHLPPIDKRTQPWKGIRFYVSKYKTTENPCTLGEEYYAIIKVKIHGTIKYNDGTYSKTIFFYIDGTLHAGEYKNGKFQTAWDKPYDDGSCTGSFNFSFDVNTFPPNITQFYLTETVNTSNCTEIITIEGTNKNMLGSEAMDDYYQFFINGSEACLNIDKLVNTYNDRKSPYSREFIYSKECESDDYIQIFFGRL